MVGRGGKTQTGTDVVNEPEDKWPRRCWDPLNAITGASSHAQDEQRMYKVGDAFTAAVEAIGVGFTPFGETFCEELIAVIRKEKRIDDARGVVLAAHKARAG